MFYCTNEITACKFQAFSVRCQKYSHVHVTLCSLAIFRNLVSVLYCIHEMLPSFFNLAHLYITKVTVTFMLPSLFVFHLSSKGQSKSYDYILILTSGFSKKLQVYIVKHAGIRFQRSITILEERAASCLLF